MMNINDIPPEQQFTFMLKQRQEKDIEKDILALDYTNDNLPELRRLFQRLHEIRGIS